MNTTNTEIIQDKNSIDIVSWWNREMQQLSLSSQPLNEIILLESGSHMSLRYEKENQS